MTDISQIPTEELMKVAGIQSSSSAISKMSNDDLAKIAGVKLAQQSPQPSQTSNPSLLDKIANSKLVEDINAIGGGSQETLGNSIKYAGGLVGDLTGSDKIKQGAAKIGDTLGNRPDFVKEAQSEHPILSMAGNAIGGGMAMGMTGMGAEAAGLKALAPYVSNAAISASTSEDGLTNRVIGAGLGAGVTGAADILGKLSGKLISAASASTQLKGLSENINSFLKGQSSDSAAAQSISNMWDQATKIRDELYNNFKLAKGNVSASAIATQAKKALTELDDVLTQGQKGAFKAIMNQADNVKYLNDLHELDKSFRDMKALFLKSGTAPDVGSAFKSLRNLTGDTLTANAENLNVGNALALARKYNKEVIDPLQDFGAPKIASGDAKVDGLISKYLKNPSTDNPEGSPESLGKLLNAMDSDGREIITNNLLQRINKSIEVGADGANPLKGIKTIDSYIQSYSKQLGPESVAKLKGMQEILKQMDINPSTAMKQTMGYAKQMALPATGAIIGAGHGYSQGGTGQAVTEGAAGIAGTLLIKHLLSSELGPSILRFIGNHATATQMVKGMLTHFSAAGAGHLENKLSH